MEIPLAPFVPLRPMEPSLPFITTAEPSAPLAPTEPFLPLAPSLPTVMLSDKENSTVALPLVVSLVWFTTKFLPDWNSTVLPLAIF